MPRSAGPALVALVLAPYLAMSGALPHEHVHEADAEHHRHAAHRHVQLHGSEAPGLHHQPRLADDDGPVVWLDDSSLTRASYHLLAPVLATTAVALADVPTRSWAAGVDYSAAPPHGPPRPQPSLRAPPAFPPVLV